MPKKGTIVSYSHEELERMREQGDTLTDWARVDAMSEEELEAAIASDPDWRDIPKDWVKHARPGLPFPLPKEGKRQVTLRLDPDILEHFSARAAAGRPASTRCSGPSSRRSGETERAGPPLPGAVRRPTTPGDPPRSYPIAMR
jgi:uncharacterized protein (DUF4415 family)